MPIVAVNTMAFQGFDLKDKTLGVIGCGNIGRHSVKIGRGFGMEVLVYDVKEDKEFAKETGCTFSNDLDEVLAKSDVITLHVPYIPDEPSLRSQVEDLWSVDGSVDESASFLASG